MHDLALEVRLVDDVGVDDPERADSGRGEVERRRRAEAAGADEQDARVEEALLPVLADLRDEQVAAVAGALLGREDARDRDVEAVALPVGEAAGEVDDVHVAELLEHLRGEGRARAGRAVDDERASLVGHEALDPLLEAAAARVDRAGDVPLVPLVRLADVDEERPVRRLEALVRLDGGDLVDLALDLCQQLAVRRHYFRNYSVGSRWLSSGGVCASPCHAARRRGRGGCGRCRRRGGPLLGRRLRWRSDARRRAASSAKVGRRSRSRSASAPTPRRGIWRGPRLSTSGETPTGRCALREARLARGEGRHRVRRRGRTARSTGSSSSRSSIRRSRSCSSTSDSRGCGRTRAIRWRRGARRSTPSRTRRTRSWPGTSSIPIFRAVFPRSSRRSRLRRRSRASPPARQLEALRVAAQSGEAFASSCSTASASSASGRPVSAARVFDRASRRFPNDVEAQVAGAVGQFDKDAPEKAFGRLGPLSRHVSERADACASISASCCCGRAGSRAPSGSSARREGAARLAARARGHAATSRRSARRVPDPVLTTAVPVTTV